MLLFTYLRSFIITLALVVFFFFEISRGKECLRVEDFINIYRNEYCLCKVKSKDCPDRSKSCLQTFD